MAAWQLSSPTPPTPSAKPAGPRPDGWSLFALGLITVMLLGLFARVTQLQTRPSPELAQHMGDRVSTVAEHGRLIHQLLNPGEQP